MENQSQNLPCSIAALYVRLVMKILDPISFVKKIDEAFPERYRKPIYHSITGKQVAKYTSMV